MAIKYTQQEFEYLKLMQKNFSIALKLKSSETPKIKEHWYQKTVYFQRFLCFHCLSS